MPYTDYLTVYRPILEPEYENEEIYRLSTGLYIQPFFAVQVK